VGQALRAGEPFQSMPTKCRRHAKCAARRSCVPSCRRFTMTLLLRLVVAPLGPRGASACAWQRARPTHGGHQRRSIGTTRGLARERAHACVLDGSHSWVRWRPLEPSGEWNMDDPELALAGSKPCPRSTTAESIGRGAERSRDHRRFTPGCRRGELTAGMVSPERSSALGRDRVLDSVPCSMPRARATPRAAGRRY
jgi:hypothetical protein